MPNSSQTQSSKSPISRLYACLRDLKEILPPEDLDKEATEETADKLVYERAQKRILQLIENEPPLASGQDFLQLLLDPEVQKAESMSALPDYYELVNGICVRRTRPEDRECPLKEQCKAFGLGKCQGRMEFKNRRKTELTDMHKGQHSILTISYPRLICPKRVDKTLRVVRKQLKADGSEVVKYGLQKELSPRSDIACTLARYTTRHIASLLYEYGQSDESTLSHLAAKYGMPYFLISHIVRIAKYAQKVFPKKEDSAKH